ncbi:unnamed protein product [Blepharisma stoltei]|uniref:Translation initiation factor 5A C-terminal domain-containing protein n=1 Tax=Blepharisma stoltei TaxID=1481888 RepID=A0AAU9I576_9CILI|nr:unnamed protein product [Blepharisma stoltei]
MEHEKTVDTTASETYPPQVASLKKGDYCVLRGHLAKIMEIEIYIGSHGPARTVIKGIDVFTGYKHKETYSVPHNIDSLNITRIDYTLCDIARDGFVSLMDEKGNIKEDLRLPNTEEGAIIRSLFEAGQTVSVTVMKAIGQEWIMAGKEI